MTLDNLLRREIDKMAKTREKYTTAVFLTDEHCVPLDTSEVLTKQGWKMLADVREGEQVVIADEEQNLRWGEVQGIVIKPEPEEVITFENTSNFKFESTPQHRNLVHTGRGVAIQTTDHLTQIQLKRFVCAGIWEEGGGSVIDDDLLWLLGFVIGDGTRDTDNWKVAVYNQDKLNVFMECFDEGWCTYNINKHVNGVAHVFRMRAAVTKVFDEFLSPTKQPNVENFLALTEEQMQLVLAGWFAADGVKRDRPVKTIHSISEELIQLYQILNTLTGRATTQGKTQCNKNSTFPSDRPLYTVSAKNRDVANVTGVGETRITQVGCIRVSTGLFLLKQGPTTLITGNCPYIAPEMVKVAEEYLRDEKPRYRIHGGDLFDNPGMSIFDPDPNHKRDTQEEIDEAVQYLHRLYKASPETEVIILAGNHDVGRLERLKSTRGMGLKNLRSLDYPHLINESAAHQGLEIGNPKFAADFELCGGYLHFTHGDPRMDPRIKGGVTGPRRTAETHPAKGHVIMGHRHKSQTATGPWGHRKVYQVAAMMDLSHKAYTHHSDYENGFLVVKYAPNVRPVPSIHVQNIVASPSGDMLIDGKEYKGR